RVPKNALRIRARENFRTLRNRQFQNVAPRGADLRYLLDECVRDSSRLEFPSNVRQRVNDFFSRLLHSARRVDVSEVCQPSDGEESARQDQSCPWKATSLS